MLLPFFYALRSAKIPVGIQEWLTLVEILSLNLEDCSLDNFYSLARAVLVKSEAHYDIYDRVFLACSKDIQDNPELGDEIRKWLNQLTDPSQRPPMPDVDPLTLEALMKKLEERLKEQREEHNGGNYWIGTRGTSPFGHSGSNPSGVRIGGPGGGRMAMKVAEERRYANLRQDRILDTRQFKVALKRLRKLERHGPRDVLSLDKTIDETCRNAGDIELVFEADRKNQTELVMFLDVGGSMDPYIELTESLFSAAHATQHFKRFKHYYFHNCIYSRVFNDMNRREELSLAELFKKFTKSTSVVFVGDACMNPYELFAPGGSVEYWENNPTTGLQWLKTLQEKFPKSIWLNPEPDTFWNHVTIDAVKKIFPMFPLTVEGLTKGVDFLRKGKKIALEEDSIGRR